MELINVVLIRFSGRVEELPMTEADFKVLQDKFDAYRGSEGDIKLRTFRCDTCSVALDDAASVKKS